jgi:hypothetical protein
VIGVENRSRPAAHVTEKSNWLPAFIGENSSVDKRPVTIILLVYCLSPGCASLVSESNVGTSHGLEIVGFDAWFSG